MDDSRANFVLLFQVVSTLFMVGVIWFVQIVHYPLMAHVGREQFLTYEQAHTRRTTWVVGPPMLIELGSGLLLLWIRPTGVSLFQSVVGIALLVIIWASTLWIQIPCHNRLSSGFDPCIHRRLVATNWIRTTAWTLRGVLASGMIWKTFSEVCR